MKLSQGVKNLLIEHKEELKKSVPTFVGSIEWGKIPNGIADELFRFLLDSLQCTPEFLVDGLEKIPDYLYEGLVDLTEFKCPDSIRVIGDAAFWGTGLSKIDLNKTETIKEDVFVDCANLNEITIPSTVISIADNSFDNDQLVIVCDKGSYAEEWAGYHGYDCRAK